MQAYALAGVRACGRAGLLRCSSACSNAPGLWGGKGCSLHRTTKAARVRPEKLPKQNKSSVDAPVLFNRTTRAQLRRLWNKNDVDA